MSNETRQGEPAALRSSDGLGGVQPERTLPADVARCSGYEIADGDLRDGCSDCMRRTDRSTFPQQAWMAPPLLVVFECEARIAP